MNALDDDAHDFVTLWDFVQHWKHYAHAISADDEALLEQLVDFQNFAIALELLQMRLQHYANILPHDIRSLVMRRKKCIKVRDTTAFEACCVSPQFTPRSTPAPKDYLAPPLTDADIAAGLVAQDHYALVGQGESAAAVIHAQNLDYEASLMQDAARQSTAAVMGSTTDHQVPLPMPEPLDDDAITVCVSVAPDGMRFTRRFPPWAAMQDVAHWIHHDTRTPVTLFTCYPRAELPLTTLLSDAPLDRKRLSLVAEINVAHHQ